MKLSGIARTIRSNRNAQQALALMVSFCLTSSSLLISSPAPDAYEGPAVYAFLLPMQMRAFAILLIVWLVRSRGEDAGKLLPEFESSLPAWLWILSSRTAALTAPVCAVLYLAVLLVPGDGDFARWPAICFFFEALLVPVLLVLSVALYALTTWKGKRDRTRKSRPAPRG